MKLSYILFFVPISILMGIFFLAYQQEWIIFRSPWNTLYAPYSALGMRKQHILLFFPNYHHIKHEQKELIIADSKKERTATLISAWLSYLHEENIIKNKIKLQSALFDPTESSLYISFDQPIFNKQQSTYSKWLLIQSLLQTIHKNKIEVCGVYFLVNHAEMQDEHLDFSHRIPVCEN